MDRFTVTYHVTGQEDEIAKRALGIALEQTIELPANLATPGFVADEVVGQILSTEALGGDVWEVKISYHPDAAGGELTQLLNVIFGNSSIQSGIRLASFELPEAMMAQFKGPRFGVADLRELVGVPEKPLIQTALKPMGTDAKGLAELAYKFALGGVDVIKDDHGLANQVWAPFEERVEACVAAVNKANAETGGKTVYAPNVSGDFNAVMKRAKFAKQAGAGALLLCPGLTGFDAMRTIADDDSIALPIIAHPSLLGGNVTSRESGFSHRVLFGQIARLCGADSSVYPNYGGRFGFSKQECLSIVDGCLSAWGHLKTVFPTPGGGMTLDRVEDMQATYGNEVMYLIGGGLYGLTDDLVKSTRIFREALGR